jgi:hypothetical protein
MTISFYYKDIGILHPPQKEGRLKIFVIIFTDEAIPMYEKIFKKFSDVISTCFPFGPDTRFSHVLTGMYSSTDFVSFDFKEFDITKLPEEQLDEILRYGQFGFSVLSSPDGSMHDIYSVCSSRSIRKVTPKFFDSVFRLNTLSTTQLLFNGAIDLFAGLFPATRFSLGVLFDNPDYEAAVKVYTRAGFTNPQQESSLDMPSLMGIPIFLKLSTSAATYKQDRSDAVINFRKALRIRKNFWKDPCSGSRGVLVINFIEDSTQSLVYSGKFCDDTEKIPYEVIYTDVELGNYTVKSVELAQVLASAIAECSLTIMYVNGDLTVPMFQDFISRVGQFANAVAYVSSSSTPVEVPGTVLGLRILNVQDSPEVTFLTQTEQKADHEIIKVNLAFQPQTRDLECTWWFQRSVLKAFGCGINRLLQRSGTCFLNTIVNGFLLSENPRKMLLANLDMILVNEPEYRAILEKPLEEWACPLRYQARQSLDFMNMILYRTYKRTKIKSTFDILKLTSRKFVSMNASPTDALYGEGGHSVYTIIDFLKNVNFPGFVGNTSNGTYKYLITPPESARNYLILFQYLNSLNTIPADPHEFAKFHYYIDVNESDFASPHLDMMGTVYDLEFVTIFIGAPATATLREFRHVILGFVCNGVQMIYDSEFNKIIKANWQNLTDPTTVRSIKRLYPAFTHLKITAAFYMNSNIY